MRRQLLYTRQVFCIEISSIEDGDPCLSYYPVIVMQLGLIIRDEFLIILLAVSTLLGNFLNGRMIKIQFCRNSRRGCVGKFFPFLECFDVPPDDCSLHRQMSVWSCSLETGGLHSLTEDTSRCRGLLLCPPGLSSGHTGR